MRTAILTGLNGNDNDPSAVSGSCPTSNCTWNPYTSLALCPGVVEDISSAIQKECLTETYADGGGTVTFCNVTTSTLKAKSKSISGSRARMKILIYIQSPNTIPATVQLPLEIEKPSSSWWTSPSSIKRREIVVASTVKTRFNTAIAFHLLP